MKEIWSSIKGYEGYYEVSSLGNVRSVTRIITRKDGVVQIRESRLMTATENADGYLEVKLSKERIRKTFKVHRLVAEAFVPLPSETKDEYRYEVNHIDCNRKNNHYDNLEWVTHADNVKYAIQQGNHVCTRDLTGNNNPNYGNHTLSDFYSNHPELKKGLGRPGKQNGRAKRIAVFNESMNQVASFDWIGECAGYLVETGISSANPKYLRDRIARAASTHKKYLGHYFKFL